VLGMVEHLKMGAFRIIAIGVVQSIAPRAEAGQLRASFIRHVVNQIQVFHHRDVSVGAPVRIATGRNVAAFQKFYSCNLACDRGPVLRVEK